MSKYTLTMQHAHMAKRLLCVSYWKDKIFSEEFRYSWIHWGVLTEDMSLYKLSFKTNLVMIQINTCTTGTVGHLTKKKNPVVIWINVTTVRTHKGCKGHSLGVLYLIVLRNVVHAEQVFSDVSRSHTPTGLLDSADQFAYSQRKRWLLYLHFKAALLTDSW